MKRSLLTGAFAAATSGLLGAPAWAQSVIYIPVTPPAPVTETQPPAPGTGYTWISGYYRWDEPEQRYFWVPGHYVHTPAAPRDVWVAGHWRQDADGWYWVPGHWMGQPEQMPH
ncbi:MAG: YXWGXW repeat-containing protein [Candidatus Eremiobacteraeota bacterium]|nr:YXWGXW repeat-containing protein [Candidatus Eremiobacteraeota bacterium]